MILYDKISKALYEGDYVLGVFQDFSKGFDTVNHEMLLRKLYSYGIRGIAHEWLKSYLDCRSQYVVFNEAESKPMNITCGVPQGSILGPLLFLLYNNDMLTVSNILFPILFADDTNVFMSRNNMLMTWYRLLTRSWWMSLSGWMPINCLLIYQKLTI